MYKTHNGFYPPDDQTTIWRYIDFTKFVDLIHTQSVYFARADKFEDPFEGMYPVKAEIEREFSKYDIIRKHNYLSCWAIGEYESAALWKLYSDSKNSIALQSTFRNLRNSIQGAKEDVYASAVRYKDYERTDLMGIIKENQWPNEPRGSTVFPVIYKRMSFAFENELRLIHINVPVTLGINEGLLPGGKRIKVDLDEMIVKVHLSPYSEKWFQELVEGLMEKYSLGHKPTARSDLFSSLK